MSTMGTSEWYRDFCIFSSSIISYYRIKEVAPSLLNEPNFAKNNMHWMYIIYESNERLIERIDQFYVDRLLLQTSCFHHISLDV